MLQYSASVIRPHVLHEKNRSTSIADNPS